MRRNLIVTCLGDFSQLLLEDLLCLSDRVHLVPAHLAQHLKEVGPIRRVVSDAVSRLLDIVNDLDDALLKLMLVVLFDFDP